MKNNFIFIMCVVLASVTVFISVYVFEHFRIDSEISRFENLKQFPKEMRLL